MNFAKSLSCVKEVFRKRHAFDIAVGMPGNLVAFCQGENAYECAAYLFDKPAICGGDYINAVCAAKRKVVYIFGFGKLVFICAVRAFLDAYDLAFGAVNKVSSAFM